MRHSNLADSRLDPTQWLRYGITISINQLPFLPDIGLRMARSVGFGGAGRINSRIPVASPWREAGYPWWTVGWLNEPASSGREPVVQWISGEKWDGSPRQRPGAAQARHRWTERLLTPGTRRACRDWKWESADKPGSVEGNHPSGTRVAARLERPTRKLLRAAGAGSVARVFPYLVLLQVGFAVPPNVATGAVRSYRTLSPLPSPHCCELGRSALCCTFRGLAPPRRYLAPCPVEPGLSSANGAAVAWPTPAPIIQARSAAAALDRRDPCADAR